MYVTIDKYFTKLYLTMRMHAHYKMPKTNMWKSNYVVTSFW